MYNYVTKQPYSGNNAMILATSGFSQPYFLTYKQAKDNGMTVRKGEHGITLMRVVSVKEFTKSGYRTTTKPKHFTVFNIEQVDPVTSAVVETAVA